MTSHQVIIVTGAAGGIGNAIVSHLLQKNTVDVVATDVVEGNLRTMEEKYNNRIKVFVGDIVDPATSHKCVQMALIEFGKLTGVALIAGVFGPCHRLVDANIDDWQSGLQINVLAQLNMLHYAIPHLRETKGCIVTATSGAGAAALFPGWGFYGLSKAALAHLIRQVHLEEKNITAVGISPGLCDTTMISKLRSGQANGWTQEDIDHYESFVSKIPLITAKIAATSYAELLLHPNPALSGLVVDYDDHRLPIDDSLKRLGATSNLDYTQFSTQASARKSS